MVRWESWEEWDEKISSEEVVWKKNWYMDKVATRRIDWANYDLNFNENVPRWLNKKIQHSPFLPNSHNLELLPNWLFYCSQWRKSQMNEFATSFASQSERVEMTRKIFGDKCVSKKKTKERVVRAFWKWRTTSDIVRARVAVEEDNRLTVVESDLAISKTVWKILNENSGMTRGKSFASKSDKTTHTHQTT